jgi:hypothetical protein
MKIDTIFLDVDGVIADFTKAAFLLYDRPDLITDATPGEYGIAKLLGISESEFWKGVDTDEFWATIPVYPGARQFVKELFSYCKCQGIKLSYCSVGTKFGYYAGARSWWLEQFNRDAAGVRGKLDIPTILMSSSSDKVLMAREGRMFIDDNDVIVGGVRAAGAVAVQPPRVWNNLHAYVSTPTNYEALYMEILEEVEASELEAAPVERSCGGNCTCGGKV